MNGVHKTKLWWGFAAVAVLYGDYRHQHQNNTQDSCSSHSDIASQSCWKASATYKNNKNDVRYADRSVGAGTDYNQINTGCKNCYNNNNKNNNNFKNMRGSSAGITDGLRGASKSHYAVLTVLDMIISALVISPLVVTYWRGTWCLMDHYVYPDRPDYSSYVSLGIGLSVLLLFTLLQGPLTNHLHPDKHRLSYYIFSRLYTAIFGFSCVNSWRGAWIFLDVYTGDSADTVLATTLTSAALLACLRTLRNISAPPFAVVTDRTEGYFEVPTMFRISGSKDTWLYILDCFFSVFIIGTLVVFVWRGVWCLLDIYLFPEREDLSAWGSLAMGYILVFSTFATQPLVKSLVIKVSGFWRLALVDIYLIFSFCGTVNVWRGVWNLLNLYFLPERKVMSYWVTHVACFLLLVFINSSNSILVRGVYIDAEEEGAQCVDFPCYYLRLFFQARRRKKLLRQLQKRQIANLVGKKNETDLFPVPVTQDGMEKTKQLAPIQVVDPSQAV